MLLTDRDIEILRWVARHGVVTTEQIARRFFPTPQGFSAATQRLRKLCTMIQPVLQRDLTHYRKPPVLRVTTQGARLADVGIGPARLIPNEVPHALNVVDLTEELLEKTPSAVLTTEREHRTERYREKRAGGRKSTGRIPDAVFTVPKGPGEPKERTVAVELDRSPRQRLDIESIVRQYQAESFDTVIWFVRKNRVEPTEEIVRRLRADDFIEVRSWHY